MENWFVFCEDEWYSLRTHAASSSHSAHQEPRGQQPPTDRIVVIHSTLLLLLLLLPQTAVGQTRPVALPTHSNSSLGPSGPHRHL
jgi:hypothetical protein